MEIKSIKLQEIAEALNSLNEKEKLEYIIELGTELNESVEKKPEYSIDSCTTEAYIKISEKEGKLFLEGTADSLVVKGYINILKQAINEQPKDYAKKDFEKDMKKFLNETKLEVYLAPNRASVFGNMIQHIKQKVKKL